MNGLTDMAALPDHPVWLELENVFRVRLHQTQRQEIIHVIRHVMAERPETDLNDLVLRVTKSVLTKSARRAG
jgi:hypothetical protein